MFHVQLLTRSTFQTANALNFLSYNEQNKWIPKQLSVDPIWRYDGFGAMG